jgi:hypothetical protein
MHKFDCLPFSFCQFEQQRDQAVIRKHK